MKDSELRTDGISSCSGSGSSISGQEMVEDDVDEGTTGDDSGNINDVDEIADASRFYVDDDSKIDINSVISGNVDDDVNDDESDDDRGDDQPSEVFGRNLGAIFEDNANVEKFLTNGNPVDDAGDNCHAAVVKRARDSNANPSRPPLAPGRPATATASLRAVDENHTRAAKGSSSTPAVDDPRLSVWLRIRPPVCSNGKKDVNTIEVLVDGETATSSLSTTIRTYPPLNSNAAKVVRGGSKLAAMSDSLHLMKKSASLVTKSFIDDGSSDGGSVDLNAEVRGVKEYSYSGVFGPNSKQMDVYDSVAAPLVEGLFKKSSDGEGASLALGESALLFTLGVTNAGKTYTVMGTGFETETREMDNINSPHKDWGIIPRSLDHILSRVNALNSDSKSGPRLQVFMSYLEIYNENIYDLLPQKSDITRRPCDGPPSLKLRESRRGRIFVSGLARHAVDNVQMGLELLKMAKNNRHTASNNINATSSRSHSICQWEIALSPGGPGDATDKSRVPSNAIADSECDTDDESVCSKSSSHNRQRKSSVIWIVDLAGSERSKRTRSHSIHQREAALINASLMNLMRCLREMLNHQPKNRGVASKGGVVPFRESKLTHMFMNHLTGPAASKTTMIVNVNPGADDYDETQHVLGYAVTARNVKISAVDYNRQRLKFVKESEAASKSSPKRAITLKGSTRLAKIVHKLSPKKRKKATVESSSNLHAKRLRSNSDSDTTALNNSKTFALAALNPLHGNPKPGAQDNSDQLEALREENFVIKAAVEDLRQQLTECENEVREEVVAMMSEQLQESKKWYENRILQLKQHIDSIQSTAPAHTDVESNEADLLERIDECEEEMKRMREDHIAEVEELTATHLHLNNENQLALENLAKEHKLGLQIEQAKSKRLEAENGALRHQSRELQFSHDSLLAKYNALLDSTQQQDGKSPAYLEKEIFPSAAASMPESPSFRKLRREKVTGVASTTTAVDNISPKVKKTGWFGKSPMKVTALGGMEVYPAEIPSNKRSPLGKIL